MAEVVLSSIRKQFGDVVAVNDVNLTIEDGEFLVLVGPSGCGKSTCLRMIAGLEDPTGGTISIGPRVVNDVPPQDRDIAMVFQNYALYPHMTVYDNLAFGLRLKREASGKALPRSQRVYSEDDIRARVSEAASLLGLEELLRRKPRQLSGGQQQRVALGRAIVREPQVFLMDEPLSNLDAKLRVQTRGDLIRLHNRLGQAGKSNTTVYVTHDQTEAMTMGDRIAVLKDGDLMQVDAPLTLYNRPANKFVAEFIGSPQMNVFGPLRVEGNGGGIALLGPGELRLELPEPRAKLVADRVGGEVLFGIRPEDIFSRDHSRVAPTDGNTLPVAIEVREPLGATVFLQLQAMGGINLAAVLDSDATAWRDERFDAVLDLNKAHLFDPETEAAIF